MYREREKEAANIHTYCSMSFEEVVERFSDLVTRVAVVRTGNSSDAEDCHQNVFLKLLTRPPDAESPERLKAWLITVTINECRDLARRRFFRDFVNLDDIAELASEADENDLSVMSEVMRLPAIYREVIYLHYFEGCNIAELAKMLRCREGTVKSRLSRGRAMLKIKLEEERWE